MKSRAIANLEADNYQIQQMDAPMYKNVQKHRTFAKVPPELGGGTFGLALFFAGISAYFVITEFLLSCWYQVLRDYGSPQCLRP